MVYGHTLYIIKHIDDFVYLMHKNHIYLFFSVLISMFVKDQFLSNQRHSRTFFTRDQIKLKCYVIKTGLFSLLILKITKVQER